VLCSGSKDSTATWHLIPANTAHFNGTQVTVAAQEPAALPTNKHKQQTSQQQQQRAALLACHSSRQRLRGAEVSLYTDATSPEALGAANGQLGTYLLPGESSATSWGLQHGLEADCCLVAPLHTGCMFHPVPQMLVLIAVTKLLVLTATCC
jgi:hypothetical protein